MIFLCLCLGLYPLKLNFWLFLFQRAESSSSSKTFQTSIDDSENISDDKSLEVTSTSKEKGISPKHLCFTDEATELSIFIVSFYRVKLARW